MYSFSQKQFIPSVGLVDTDQKIVLIADPALEMCNIYKRMLNDLQYLAHTCHVMKQLDSELSHLDPHVLIVNLNPFAHKAVAKIKKIKEKYPSLSIITLSEAGIDVDLHRLMELGIVGHLNKELTKPNDLVVLVKHVIEY